MDTIPKKNYASVKIYHGYGHEHNLVVQGHVLQGHPFVRKKYTNNIFYNIRYILRLFFIKPIPAARVCLSWQNQQMETLTQKDGFFKFEWKSINSVPAGWHSLKAELLDKNNNVFATGEGKVFVPHIAQHAFISDIDDTVLISHSATIFKRLRVLFTKNPRSRKAFADVVKHYSLLSRSNAEPDVPNPFFYVSSSEWNLYNDLDDFFRHNQLPPGVFLLNEIKRWYQLFKTGKTKHQGKLTRVARIMEVFPQQQFVLLGDNSQKDPEIYAAIANKYRERIVAVYIRNISPKKHSATEATLATISNKNIYTCIYNSDEEAIQYSKKIGLITEP